MNSQKLTNFRVISRNIGKIPGGGEEDEHFFWFIVKLCLSCYYQKPSTEPWILMLQEVSESVHTQLTLPYPELGYTDGLPSSHIHFSRNASCASTNPSDPRHEWVFARKSEEYGCCVVLPQCVKESRGINRLPSYKQVAWDTIVDSKGKPKGKPGIRSTQWIPFCVGEQKVAMCNVHLPQKPTRRDFILTQLLKDAKQMERDGFMVIVGGDFNTLPSDLPPTFTDNFSTPRTAFPSDRDGSDGGDGDATCILNTNLNIDPRRKGDFCGRIDYVWVSRKSSDEKVVLQTEDVIGYNGYGHSDEGVSIIDTDPYSGVPYQFRGLDHAIIRHSFRLVPTTTLSPGAPSFVP
jgi:hypothetical protein